MNKITESWNVPEAPKKMNQSKHTELPYSLSSFRPLDQKRPTPKSIYAGVGENAEKIATVSAITNKDVTIANAEFIVKACNNHYQLLEVCKEALTYIKENKPKYETEAYRDTFIKIEDSISQVEGK